MLILAPINTGTRGRGVYSIRFPAVPPISIVNAHATKYPNEGFSLEPLIQTPNTPCKIPPNPTFHQQNQSYARANLFALKVEVPYGASSASQCGFFRPEESGSALTGLASEKKSLGRNPNPISSRTPFQAIRHHQVHHVHHRLVPPLPHQECKRN